MKKMIAGMLLSVLLLSSIVGCTAQQNPPNSVSLYPTQNDTPASIVPTITVSGKGELTLAPDMATIQFGVEAKRQATAVEAMEAVGEAMLAVENALVSLGVQQEDLQTSNFSIYESYRYDDKGNQIGDPQYNVSNTLSASIYDMDNIGMYIDAAIQAGATNSYGIEFSFADPAEKENEALALAYENALARAEALAAAAGKQVDDVLMISDGTQLSEEVVYDEAYPMARAQSAAAENALASSADTSIQPGTKTLTATVSVRFTM